MFSVRRERKNGKMELSWLYRVGGPEYGRPLLRGQVHLGGSFCHVKIGVDGPDHEIQASVAVPGFAFWATLELPYLGRVGDAWKRLCRNLRYPKDDPEISLAVHHGAFWWSFWTPRSSWSSDTPRWRHGAWYPMDAIFGEPKYSEEALREETVMVPMPERSYRWKAALQRATWKRPRWPFATTVLRAKMEAYEGEQIPVPGKGENGWDCDEDATYGLVTHVRSVAEGIGKVVTSALETRHKYGGANWVPESTKVTPG